MKPRPAILTTRLNLHQEKSLRNTDAFGFLNHEAVFLDRLTFFGLRIFHIEQLSFDVETTTVATQRATGSDDPVTRNDNCYGIVVVGLTNSAERFRTAYLSSDVGIRASFAIGNAEERLPTLLLCCERAAHRQNGGNVNRGRSQPAEASRPDSRLLSNKQPLGFS